MSGPPWRVDLRGIAIGQPLDELTRRRLGLVLDEADTQEGCSWWMSSLRDFWVVTTDGLVSLVSFGDSAVVDGTELVGADRSVVTSLLGSASSVDEVADAVTFRSGVWELTVGFDADRVTWVFLSNDEILA